MTLRLMSAACLVTVLLPLSAHAQSSDGLTLSYARRNGGITLQEDPYISRTTIRRFSLSLRFLSDILRQDVESGRLRIGSRIMTSSRLSSSSSSTASLSLQGR